MNMKLIVVNIGSWVGFTERLLMNHMIDTIHTNIRIQMVRKTTYRVLEYLDFDDYMKLRSVWFQYAKQFLSLHSKSFGYSKTKQEKNLMEVLNNYGNVNITTTNKGVVRCP